MTDHQWVNETTEQYYKEIYCYCRRHVSHEDTAYELTQTVFLRFCEQYRTVDRASVRAWLYRVAKNICADHYREVYRTREWSTDIPPEQCEDGFAQIDNALVQVEFMTAVSSLLEKLTESERELFSDRYEKGLSYTTLAEQQKTTPSTVRKRVSRLHKKLVKYMKLLFCI